MNRILSVLCFSTLVSSFQVYTPETYPDSLIQPAACSIPEGGFICDPNAVITANESLALIHKLVQVQHETNCSCTGGSINQCDSANLGFIVSVALTRKMVLNDDEQDRKLEAAEIFANKVRSRQNRGHCDDDLLIFISEYDRTVWTSIGTKVQEYISDEMINSISTRAEDVYFEKGEYYEGLNYMIDSYVKVLRGEHLVVTENNGWYWPLPLWAVITIGVSSLIVILALIALSIYCCAKKCCCQDRRGHYETTATTENYRL